MPKIDPKKISGKWIDGYALDRQVTNSNFIGYNESGHPQFDTTRSEVGEALYKLKYKSDKSGLNDLVTASTNHLSKWKPKIDSIIPATASQTRTDQPVALLVGELAKKTGLEMGSDWIVRNSKTPQLKNLEPSERQKTLIGVHTVDKKKVKDRRILIVDDLYDTGSTLNAMTKALMDAGAKSVHVLTLTRTGKS